MPITDFNKLVRFSKACGAEIPKWLYKRLEILQDDASSLRQLGEEIIIQFM